MKTYSCQLGRLETNCYLLIDENEEKAAVVDPGADESRLYQMLEDAGVTHLDYILLTHGHYDHIGGVAKLKEKYGGKICIHTLDSDFPRKPSLNLAHELFGILTPFDSDILLDHDDLLCFGTHSIKVMHTPGHTHGSCCFLCDDLLFSGDTLFCGSMGRTDFPTGSFQEMMKSLKTLYEMEGDYHVFPGHGPESTLSWERKNNPYMRF